MQKNPFRTMAKRKKSFLYNENIIWERGAVVVKRRDGKEKREKVGEKT